MGTHIEYLTFYILNKLVHRIDKEMLAVQSNKPNPKYFVALAEAQHAIKELRSFY